MKKKNKVITNYQGLSWYITKQPELVGKSKCKKVKEMHMF